MKNMFSLFTVLCLTAFSTFSMAQTETFEDETAGSRTFTDNGDYIALDASTSSIPPTDIVITEIMYNPPGVDTYEFIELYNNGTSIIDLTGWYFTQGISHTFGSVGINPGEYLVLALSKTTLENALNISGVIEWTSGTLTNSGETITLVDNNGVVADEVPYDDSAPWPIEPDGLGSSLILCDYNTDNSQGSNWIAALSSAATGVELAGIPLLCSPGNGDGCIALPADNECGGATDIQSLFGGALNVAQVSGLQDNTNYTSVNDPITGIDCFYLEDGTQNTIWYTFMGDGNMYNIKTVACNATNEIPLGDTQAALYTGSCGSLTAENCAEDEDILTNAYNFNMDVTAQNGIQYYLMVDGFDQSPGEFCLQVTRQQTVTISEPIAETLSIYPNPAENVINWIAVNAQTAEVYDNTGRSVLTLAQPNGSIDISNLSEGIYTVQLITEEGSYSARVVKQ